MLQPKTEKQCSLIINNIINACKDINKLNSTGYDYIYIAGNFIAHYNIHGFKDYYQEHSLRDDILRNECINGNDCSYRIGDTDYEYYKQKTDIYKSICMSLKGQNDYEKRN